jgi:uncharacterized protein YukE
MADSTGMRVDLSALDQVISKLRGLLNDMDNAKGKAKYETDVPRSAWGGGKFLESGDLHVSHAAMKTQIEGMITQLHGLIDDFGTNTSKVRDNYSNQEHSVTQTMSGGSTTPAAPGALS